MSLVISSFTSVAYHDWMIDLPRARRLLISDRRAATAFEYALIAAFIALAISGALTVFVDL